MAHPSTEPSPPDPFDEEGAVDPTSLGPGNAPKPNRPEPVTVEPAPNQQASGVSTGTSDAEPSSGKAR